jgi:peptide alpha-N-acetyltransferase
MNFEHSEMLLYHNLIIEESGKFDKALEHLESIENDICDRRSWKEKRGLNINYRLYHSYIMLK